VAIFLGEFDHQIDDKRRLALPAVFRKRLPKDQEVSLAILPGVDPCLYIVLEDQLEALGEKLGLLHRGWDELSRAYVSKLGGLSCTTGLDSQGRLSLSPQQLEYAGITDRAIVVGCLSHIEVWDEQRYREHLEMLEKKQLDMRKLAEHALRDERPARGEGGS